MASEPASEAAVARLIRDIAQDRARLSFAMQQAQAQSQAEPSGTGRLYEVFRAAGQAQ